jgi:hypothetical protein
MVNSNRACDPRSPSIHDVGRRPTSPVTHANPDTVFPPCAFVTTVLKDKSEASGEIAQMALGVNRKTSASASVMAT